MPRNLCAGTLLVFLLPAALPAASKAAGRSEPVHLRPDLQVEALAPGVWLHTSQAPSGPFQGAAANGLLAQIEGGLLLVDTAWTDEQTEALLGWVKTGPRLPIQMAVLTHAHPDRMGGLGALRTAGIPAGALDLTVTKAKQSGAAPDVLFTAGQQLLRDPRGFELFYPGAGHTADNIVVWLPGPRVLFGGCLVKEAAASGLGNVAEADLSSWPRAVQAVILRYPAAAMVVPGHGAVGSLAALGHTLELLRQGAGTPATPGQTH